MSTHRNFIRQTISNTPGTSGGFTLSTAVSGFLALEAGDTGLTFDLKITETGLGSEARTGCVYTHGTTSLTRGTLEKSTTGAAISFTVNAVVSVVATADSGRRWDSAGLTTLAASVTTADVTGVVGTLHYLDLSGLTAARNFTLPAVAAVDDRVGVYVSAGCTTAGRELILKANTGDTLNGVSAAEWSRLFITGECVIMRCVVANTTWVVDYDGRIAQRCFARLSTNATGETAASDTYPTNNGGAWTSVLDQGNIFTAASGTVTTRRACKGNVLFSGVSVNSVSDGQYFQVGLYVAGAFALAPFLRSAATAGVIVQGSVQSYDFPNATATRYFYATGEGSRGLRGNGDISSSFGFQEVF